MSNETRQDDMSRVHQESTAEPTVAAPQIPAVIVNNAGTPFCPIKRPRFLIRSSDLTVAWTVNELNEIKFLVERFKGTSPKMSREKWTQVTTALNAKFAGEYHQVGDQIIGNVLTYHENGQWERGRWILEVQEGEEKQIPERSEHVVKMAVLKHDSYAHMKKFLWVSGGASSTELQEENV